MPESSAHRLTRLAVLLLPAVLVVPSCTSGVSGSEYTKTALAALSARPDSETADARYRALLAEITTELITRHGLPAFNTELDYSNAGCGDYPNVGGETRSYRVIGPIPPIPESAWPGAVAAVRDTIKRAGFTLESVMVDKPGDHNIYFGRPDNDAQILFGTRVYTDITLLGACHLPRSTGTSSTS